MKKNYWKITVTPGITAFYWPEIPRYRGEYAITIGDRAIVLSKREGQRLGNWLKGVVRKDEV